MTRSPYTQAEVDRIRRLTDTHGPTAAARIVGTCTATIASMRSRDWRAKQKGQPSRAIPTDFAIQAAHMTIHQLVEHYSSSNDTVLRWAKTVGRTHLCGHRFGAIAAPADLAERLRRSGTAQVARDCHVHPDTVRKWRREQQLDNAGRTTATKRGWVESMVTAVRHG